MEKKIILNEYQRAAVEDESRACLVKANVGSGKTTVLVEKLRWLHDKKAVPFEQMVVLTFTNKAAKEIEERLGAKEVYPCFGTFHSVALYLLREHLPIEQMGYRQGFAVIDPEEELELAVALAEGHGLKIKYKNRLKKRLEQEEKAWRQGREQSRQKDDLFLLFPLLEQEKIRLNRFSFGDLIRVAAALLSAEGCTFQKPDWIIVDEVQDSDRQQLEFLKALMGKESHLFAVGDPNQVIYSWRGGSENIFYLLAHTFEARELTLPVNYRSQAGILEAARCFQQSGERLQGVRDGGMPIQVRRHYDPFGEAQYLARKIRNLLENGVQAEQIAVFYRLQSQSEILEKEFARCGICCQVSVKRSALEFPVVRWLVRLLRYACNTEDTASALAVLTDKNYGPGFPAKKARILLESWQKEGEASVLPGCARMLKELPLPVSAQKLYEYLQLDDALHPAAASYQQDKGLVLEFLERALEAGKEKMQTGEKELCTLLNRFLTSSVLYGLQLGEIKAAEGKQEEKPEGGAVQLMTLHASKGLEFQYVFMIGVNYGLIPLSAKDEGEEEEERRLFFVGMTRARDYLELSYYQDPKMARVVPGESRYLSMLPAHLINRAEEEKEQKADLTAIRRAVEAQRRQRLQGNGPTAQMMQTAQKRNPDAQECRPAEKMPEAVPQRVRHARYGVGTVLEENDTQIKVRFDGIGEKEFVKAFTALERLTQ